MLNAQELLDWSKGTRGRLDYRVLKMLSGLVDQGILSDHDTKTLESIRTWFLEKRFCTESQRHLIREIAKRYQDHDKEKQLLDTVMALLAEGRVPEHATGFLNNVKDRFFRRKYLTRLEKEQVIKILHAANGNELDPEIQAPNTWR